MTIGAVHRPHDPVPQMGAIAGVDRHEWDGLVNDSDFYHCHGWLGSLDYALGAGEILTVRGRAGLLGGCALWDGENQPGLFYLPEYFPGLPGPWHTPFLWGGARRSTHNEIPCISGPHRGEALAAIAAALAAQAQLRGKTATVIPYMPLNRAMEIARHYPYARVVMHGAEATIPVLPGGLPAQLARWHSHHRGRTKAELRAFERLGNHIEWLPLTENLFTVAARLIADNRGKYGSHQGAEWIQNIFYGQRRSAIIDTAIAAVAKKNKRISAITIFYHFGQALHARYYGSDYQDIDNDFRYFALTYYYALDYADKHDITQCRLSISALHAKTFRGAQLEPLAALLLFADRPDLARTSCENYNRRFHRYYQRHFSKHLTAEWLQLE